MEEDKLAFLNQFHTTTDTGNGSSSIKDIQKPRTKLKPILYGLKMIIPWNSQMLDII